MVLRAKFGDLEIEVDQTRTAEIYRRRIDWCQCDYCTNAKITQKRFTPAAQVEWLNSLGLDPWRPCLRANRNWDRPHRRHALDISCWYVYGRIVSRNPFPKIYLDQRNWIWADTNKRKIQVWSSELDDLEGDPDLLYLFAFNVRPWLHGEVCEFRQGFGPSCEKCGNDFWVTGYLKHQSMIPEWHQRPDLRRVLLERKQRVFVAYCFRCGHMKDRLVADKSPFRNKRTEWIKRRRYHYYYIGDEA